MAYRIGVAGSTSGLAGRLRLAQGGEPGGDLTQPLAEMGEEPALLGPWPHNS